MDATLYVCITCRAGQTLSDGEATPGARLHDALCHEPPAGVRVRPVECLSACSRGCAVALSRPGGWSYVYGDLSLDDIANIRLGAAAYGRATDGLVPWRDRPVVFRKQSLARIPPMER